MFQAQKIYNTDKKHITAKCSKYKTYIALKSTNKKQHISSKMFQAQKI